MVAILGSSPKNSFPFTKILDTGLPLTVIAPSLSTATPGNFLSTSSKLASALVLKEAALNSKVSVFIETGAFVPCTTTSPNVLSANCKVMVPVFMVLFCES